MGLPWLAVSERVAHAHAFNRLLIPPLTILWLRDVRGFKHSRGDVNDVMELGAQLALRVNAIRSVHDQAIAGPAEVRSDLLRPLERRVGGPGPGSRHMRLGLRPADFVEFCFETGQAQLNAVQAGDLIDRVFQPSLAGSAVGADDLENDRIVQFT